jgi:hypothetical protein
MDHEADPKNTNCTESAPHLPAQAARIIQRRRGRTKKKIKILNNCGDRRIRFLKVTSENKHR